MLSLRDSGKIQHNNESLLNLAALCGFGRSFSLKDFIERDCLVVRRRFKLCVVLFTYNPPLPVVPTIITRTDTWYTNYYLNWHSATSVARFWYKESGGRLFIEGNLVHGPHITSAPADFLRKDNNGNPTNEVLRAPAIRQGVQIAKDRGLPVADYDGFVVILGLLPPFSLNDGSDPQVRLDGGTYNGIALRPDTREFDFNAHEVGHLIGSKLGFDHSFGREVGADFCSGLYGHPFCIMSAQTYGNLGGRFVPVITPGVTVEEQNRGPGLNGGSRFVLGWAKGIEVHLPQAEGAEFEIQSLGSNQPGTQVVCIRLGDSRFFIEYRSSRDEHDRRLPGAFLAVSVLEGGNAWHYGQGSATYLDEIHSDLFPHNPIVNFDQDWAIRVQSWDQSKNTVLFRIIKRFRFSVRTYSRTHPDRSLCTGLKIWFKDETPFKNLRSLVR